MVFGYGDPKGGSLRTKNQERGPEQRNRFGPNKAGYRRKLTIAALLHKHQIA